jgi:hypothetical protein
VLILLELFINLEPFILNLMLLLFHFIKFLSYVGQLLSYLLVFAACMLVDLADSCFQPSYFGLVLLLHHSGHHLEVEGASILQ